MHARFRVDLGFFSFLFGDSETARCSVQELGMQCGGLPAPMERSWDTPAVMFTSLNSVGVGAVFSRFELCLFLGDALFCCQVREIGALLRAIGECNAD
uniref:Uncharacterized protein n=1 Tax=Arundo donax TaxID=35708 RepID=A0A0A9HFY8_ARUDO